jgi:DNA-binding NtrC family response regulator
MMDYTWPGNIRELENLVKRYVIVGNESQIIRELSTHKPLIASSAGSTDPSWESKGNGASGGTRANVRPAEPLAAAVVSESGEPETSTLSLLEIGRRAAMIAERGAIERVLNETRWNRRQAAKILKVSYKALLNKLKVMEEQDKVNKKSSIAK